MSDTFAPMNNRLSPSLRVAGATAKVMATMERDAMGTMMEETLLMDAARK